MTKYDSSQPLSFKPIAQEFVSAIRNGDKKELVDTLIENPKVLNALTAAKESLLSNLSNDQKEIALAVLNAAKAFTTTRSVPEPVSNQASALLSSVQNETKKPTVLAGFVKEAGRSTFYNHTDLGKSIRRGFRGTQAFMIIFWVITLVLLGLTVWRATRPHMEATNALSVGIYVGTAYTFVIACVALAIYEAGRIKVKREVDKVLDRFQSVFGKLAKSSK